MELEQYDYTFEYKSGETNIVPDALSRVDIGKSVTDNDDILEDGIYYVKNTIQDIPKDWHDLLQKEQRRETNINIAIEQLENNNNIKKGRFKYYKQLSMQDNLLMKSGRIMVPSSLRFQVTKDFHCINHWGVTNTHNEISKEYYWPNMKNYIEQFCASCDTCLQTKHPSKKPKAELKPNKWSDYEPCQAIALDIASMTSSYDGFNHILLITDCMSKFTELCPIRNMTAETVVKNVKRNWIARHGIPITLLTDQGTQVDGIDIRKLCEEFNIIKKRSSPYHPEGDGISERPIGVMKGLFRRKICDKNIAQRRWTDILPDVQLAMNQKEHSATKHSPFQLLYGEVKDTNTEERKYMKDKYIRESQEKLKEASERMKRQYDKGAVITSLEKGDHVYRKRNFVKQGVSKKLSTMFYDLSIIIDSNHPVYKIRSLGSKEEKWVHHNQLRKRGTLEQPHVPPKASPNSRKLTTSAKSPSETESDSAQSLVITSTPIHMSTRGLSDHNLEITRHDETTLPLDEPASTVAHEDATTVDTDAATSTNEHPDNTDAVATSTNEHSENTDAVTSTNEVSEQGNEYILPTELLEQPPVYGRVFDDAGRIISLRNTKRD